MKKTSIISMFAIMALSLATFSASAQGIDSKPYIEVTGKAEKDIVPDEIYLSININEEDYAKKQDLATLEKSMLNELKALNIDIDRQLTIKDLASNFKKNILRKDVKLNKSYELKTVSAKQAAQVMMALENIGISEVSISKVDCSKTEEYKDELRVQAIKDAKRKAGQLTQALGQTCGKAIYILEQDYSGRRLFNSLPMMKTSVRRAADTEAMAQGSVPDIEFEKSTLEISVMVRFVLE